MAIHPAAMQVLLMTPNGKGYEQKEFFNIFLYEAERECILEKAVLPQVFFSIEKLLTQSYSVLQGGIEIHSVNKHVSHSFLVKIVRFLIQRCYNFVPPSLSV